jgi:Nucleolar pre-ribosomal-associated protein 1
LFCFIQKGNSQKSIHPIEFLSTFSTFLFSDFRLTIFKQLYSVTQNGLSELAKSKDDKETIEEKTEDSVENPETKENEEPEEKDQPKEKVETVEPDAPAAEKPPKQTEIPVPSSIPLLFISQASMILPDYLNKLHKIVTAIICVKPSFDFHAAPSFHTLFNSTDVEYVEHRAFILELLKNGLNSSLDFDILLYSPVMKILACTFKSPLSSQATDTEILNIFQRIVSVPLAGELRRGCCKTLY